MPSQLDDDEARHRARLTLLVALFFAAWGPVFALAYAVWFSGGLGLVTLLATGLLAATPWIQLRTRSSLLAGHYLCAVSYATLLTIAAHTGNVQSPAFDGLLLFPICARLIGSWRTAVGWTAIGLLTSTGWTLATASSTASSTEMLFVVGHDLAIFSCALGVAGLIERTRTHMRDELLAARGRAEATSQAHRALLATMSHEIRTPMHGVLGMTELALGTELSPRQRDYLETIRTSGASLSRILDDVLDLSKLDADRFVLEELDFDLAQQVRTLVEPLALLRNDVQLTCRIEPPTPHWVRGDPHRLRQVLTNLIDNALKFTERGRVELHLEVTPLPANRLRARFSVLDTGCGIAPSDLARIFEPFMQARHVQSVGRAGGTGLGLTISRQLVDLMGGTLTAESRLGSGTTFAFELAFAPGRPAGRRAQVATLRRHVGRALVAEDDRVNQKIAQAMLVKLGYEVELVTNGEEAVAACARKHFDVVLMDIQMPVMNGLQATRIIRSRVNARVPIVALTAQAFADDRQMCLAAGMTDYVSKPVSLDTLAVVLERARRLHPVPHHELAPEIRTDLTA